MSLISRKFLIASLIYFGLGLLAQAVAVFDTWLGLNPLAYSTMTAIEQVLLLGWLTQLGLALAYDRWLLSSKQNLVFVLFNLGLPLVIIGQPGLILFGGPWLGVVAAFGGLLQLLAGLLFIRQAWVVIRKIAKHER